jgi:anti-sigma28 factor (negative regulator of flagellin synthesis)
LKRAVESGTYQVNAEQVAAKVMAAALVDILA